MNAPYFSVVVPVFDEAENLRELHRRLVDSLQALGRPYEIIFVDDGSRDSSFDLLSGLFEADERVRVIKFSRNFGHHIALTAGIDAARGEAVVLMDADLQDQPEEIAKLYQKLEEGYDVVYGVARDRRDSWFKSCTSRLFVGLLNRIIAPAPPINTSIFRILRRKVVDAVKECREYSRFVVGLISWVGFRQTNVEIDRGDRHAGETKYSLRKMMQLATNAITAFSAVPLRIATALGAIVSAGALIAILYLLLASLLRGAFTADGLSTAALILLSGVQLLCLGTIGEYLGRTYREAQRRPLYIVEHQLERASGDGDARSKG